MFVLFPKRHFASVKLDDVQYKCVWSPSLRLIHKSSCSIFILTMLTILTIFILTKWCHRVVIINTAQLHSAKPELRFWAGSNPARGVSEIPVGEDLWQWFRLEIRLNAFRRSTIPQKQFIMMITSESAITIDNNCALTNINDESFSRKTSIIGILQGPEYASALLAYWYHTASNLAMSIQE